MSSKLIQSLLIGSGKKLLMLFYIVTIMVTIRNLTYISRSIKKNVQSKIPPNFNQVNSFVMEKKQILEEPVRYETENEFMRRMSRRMRERIGRLTGACKRLGLSSSPFQNQPLMEAKRYNFAYCRIPKTGSTNMDRIFAQLIRESDYAVKRKGALLRNFSPHRVEYVTERNFSLSEINNFLTIIIVRNPFVRLLSAFVMKVRNNGKNPNGKLDEKWLNSQEMPFNISFAEYVEHLLSNPGPYSTIERHWSKYIDLCQPCHVQYKVIAHLETIQEDMRYFFTLVGAPRNVSFSHGSGSDGSSKTKPEHLSSYFSQVQATKIRKLYTLYKSDFDIFGYEPPYEFL